MNIGINLLRFDPTKNIGGNYTYAFNIVQSLIQNKSNMYYLFLTDRNKEMFAFKADNIKCICLKSKKNIISKIFAENLFIEKQIKHLELEIFFSPCFLLPFRKLKIKSVVTIHDLNFRHFSQGFFKDIYKNILYRLTIRNSSAITTVSEFTKLDLCSFVPGFEGKIKVVYNGCNMTLESFDKSNHDSFERRYSIDYPYFLAISHYEHKNAELAIKAFALSKDKLSEQHQLIITGARHKLKEKLKTIAREEKVEKDIVFIDYVENEYIQSMYYGAKLFLFPSLFEGFGIPVIESMNMGCPVIASNNSSIPEVVGDAGILLDTGDVSQWSRFIIELSSNNDKMTSLREKGFLRASMFNWNESAIELMKIFKEVLDNKKKEQKIG
ncbi:hypothetical protein A8709_22995 [Paenibacillus pectinilyticus]|uniref:Glycosyl transferase family 1 domain-containing protein n=1 Tax=Paenibacillus pectinilyticus TaxID=512399 RepID=A0A1C0ZRL2_9BACL|nr:glycosyltransferase family 1 protein [Paenibacillus pectinilyticus]OCT10707.1 hypothetical protein A8709_22995 [Paenibacillus pectinilyticus]